MEYQGNPNLINGLEDLMAHIARLETGKGDGWYLAKLIEEECNKLKEENKKLKEKLEHTEKVRDDFIDTCASLNTALDIVEEVGIVCATKEEIDEVIESRGEDDNEKLLKILYELYNDDEENK